MPEFILPFASIGFEVRKLERPLLRPCCWQRDVRRRTCVDIGCATFFTADPNLPGSRIVSFWAQNLTKYSLDPKEPKNKLFPDEVATHVTVQMLSTGGRQSDDGPRSDERPRSSSPPAGWGSGSEFGADDLSVDEIPF